jgi:adenine-specific DNA methylase
MNHDRRLIEDYLPIEAISKEASREKSVRKGHISTLHLWWARRPLVACRAAVYGALGRNPNDPRSPAELHEAVERYLKADAPQALTHDVRERKFYAEEDLLQNNGHVADGVREPAARYGTSSGRMSRVSDR